MINKWLCIIALALGLVIPSLASEPANPFTQLLAIYQSAKAKKQDLFTFLLEDAEANKKFTVVLYQLFQTEPPAPEAVRAILLAQKERLKKNPRWEKILLRGIQRHYQTQITLPNSRESFQIIQVPTLLALFDQDPRFTRLGLTDDLIGNGKYFLHTASDKKPKGFEFWVRGTHAIDPTEQMILPGTEGLKKSLHWIHLELPEAIVKKPKYQNLEFLDAWMANHIAKHPSPGIKLIPTYLATDLPKDAIWKIQHPLFRTDLEGVFPSRRTMLLKNQFIPVGADRKDLSKNFIGLESTHFNTYANDALGTQLPDSRDQSKASPSFFNDGNSLSEVHRDFLYSNFRNGSISEVNASSLRYLDSLPADLRLIALKNLSKAIGDIDSHDWEVSAKIILSYALEGETPSIVEAAKQLLKLRPELRTSSYSWMLDYIAEAKALLDSNLRKKLGLGETISEKAWTQGSRVLDIKQLVKTPYTDAEWSKGAQHSWDSYLHSAHWNTEENSKSISAKASGLLIFMAEEKMNATAEMEKDLVTLLIAPTEWRNEMAKRSVSKRSPFGKFRALTDREVTHLQLQAAKFLERTDLSPESTSKIHSYFLKNSEGRDWIRRHSPGMISKFVTLCSPKKLLEDELE